MRTRLLLAALLLAPTAHAQLTTGPLHEAYVPEAATIHVYGGHGVPGGSDALVTYLAGPAGGLPTPLTAADFAAAEAGPAAVLLDTFAWGSLSLTTHPGPQWIAPTLGWGTGLAGPSSALLAIPFDVDVPVLHAALDFHYTADDNLGAGGTAGLYLNGQPIPNTTATAAWGDQYDFSMRPITRLLRPGKNVLHVHLINTGGAGGILFDAIVRVNQPAPDECDGARQVWLDATKGRTTGLSTSAEPASCPIQNDAWHVFVPTAPGTLTVDLDGLGGGGLLQPVLGVYSGTCGALQELACSTAPSALGIASWTGVVEPGVPLFLRVGGATAVTGRYELRLDQQAASSGFVNPANGHLYVPSPGPVGIVAARAFAASQGGYLVAINDAAEHAWVVAQTGGTSIWLGASDELSEGTWLWDSGEPFVYQAWAAGEPNDNAACGGEDFVQMDAGGAWRDYPAGPGPCGTTMRVALVELPTSSLATVTQLDGGCGPWTIQPGLASEPHVLGTQATVGTFQLEPGTPVVVLRSPPAAAPTPLGGCLVHLDLGLAVVAGTWLADDYGAGALEVAVPADPLLVGQSEVWQAQLFPLDGSISYTNAIEVQFGY